MANLFKTLFVCGSLFASVAWADFICTYEGGTPDRYLKLASLADRYEITNHGFNQLFPEAFEVKKYGRGVGTFYEAKGDYPCARNCGFGKWVHWEMTLWPQGYNQVVWMAGVGSSPIINASVTCEGKLPL